MKKLEIFFTGIVGLLGLVCLSLWLAARPSAPAYLGTFSLPNGSEVYLEAVTFGTNHTVGPRSLISRLPPVIKSRIPRVFLRNQIITPSFISPSPQLMLWFQLAPGSHGPGAFIGSLRGVLADTNGFEAGQETILSIGQGSPIKFALFGTFPRRESEFLLRIYRDDLQGKVSLCGEMRIRNPLIQSYPQWQPLPLPTTRKTGDIEATLHRVIGNASRNSGLRMQRDGRLSIEVSPPGTNQMPSTLCHLSLHSLADPDSEWRVAGVEVSDATGNRIRNGTISWSGEGENQIVSFSPGLWTNESAWKLAFDIKRIRGFRPDEQFAFHNVPLGQLNETNFINWTTNFNGVTVTLRSIDRRAPAIENFVRPNLTRVEFAVSGLTDRLQLDLIAAVASNGTNLHRITSGTGNRSRSYEFNNVPRDARTADFTFALHTNRTVEFLARPEVIRAATNWTVEQDAPWPVRW